ncbi:hypothetical protein BPO_1685 [Bergeyella porcorum]|uniref:Uncharacterized protein n=1 Tax=Bergeyella porcorum TaxID=1735111 RepID=A0AAU0F8L0_9FLAO
MGIIKTDNTAREILQILKADLTQIRRKIETLNASSANPLMGEITNISLTKIGRPSRKKS